MNVNELINKLKLVRCIAGDGQILNEAETMLRQQVNQIADLEKQVAELTEQNDRFYEELGKNYE
jgi:hypothetical protein